MVAFEDLVGAVQKSGYAPGPLWSRTNMINAAGLEAMLVEIVQRPAGQSEAAMSMIAVGSAGIAGSGFQGIALIVW